MRAGAGRSAWRRAAAVARTSSRDAASRHRPVRCPTTRARRARGAVASLTSRRLSRSSRTPRQTRAAPSTPFDQDARGHETERHAQTSLSVGVRSPFGWKPTSQTTTMDTLLSFRTLVMLADGMSATPLCNCIEHGDTGILPAVHRLEACATGLGRRSTGWKPVPQVWVGGPQAGSLCHRSGQEAHRLEACATGLGRRSTGWKPVPQVWVGGPQAGSLCHRRG